VAKPWSEEEIAKLRSMAQRYPSRRIAAVLGRGFSATVVKAHQLRLSLKVKSKAPGPTADPGEAGFNWSERSEPVARNVLIQDQD
jgi:hypothetical protein